MRDGLPWSSLRGKADISYFHALVLNRRMRIRTFGGVGGVIPLPDYSCLIMSDGSSCTDERVLFFLLASVQRIGNRMIVICQCKNPLTCVRDLQSTSEKDLW